MNNIPSVNQGGWWKKNWRLVVVILLAMFVTFVASTFVSGGWKLPKLGKSSAVVSTTTTTVPAKLPGKPKVNSGKLVKPKVASSETPKVTGSKALESPKPTESLKPAELPKPTESPKPADLPKASEPPKAPELPKQETPVVTPKAAAATTVKVEVAKKPAFVFLKDLKTGKAIGMLPPAVKAGTPEADLLLGGAINQDGSAIRQTQEAVKALADVVGPKAEKVVGEILNTPAAKPATVVLDLPAVKPAVKPQAVVPEVIVITSTITSTTTTVAPKPVEEKPKPTTTTTLQCTSSGLKPITPLSFHW